MVNGVAWPSPRASCAIRTTSSRVGAMTRARRGGPARARLLEEPREHGDEERGSFAGAGLRLAGHVLPGERDRQRLLLDGGAVRKTRSADPLPDGFGKIEAVEGAPGRDGPRVRRLRRGRVGHGPLKDDAKGGVSSVGFRGRLA